MPLNESKGNMYPWVTYTWNTVRGRCPHDCSYCYMKRFNQRDLHFADREMSVDLGAGRVIFVGSSCDMFADRVPALWINEHLRNVHTFQTTCTCFKARIPPGCTII
jgi:DNA repair photolyase